MNTTQTQFLSTRAGRTQNDLLADFLQSAPNTWHPMPALAKVITPTGIGAAVHSRIADLRARGLVINHRSGKNPETGLRESEYMLVTQEPVTASVPSVPSVPCAL